MLETNLLNLKWTTTGSSASFSESYGVHSMEREWTGKSQWRDANNAWTRTRGCYWRSGNWSRMQSRNSLSHCEKRPITSCVCVCVCVCVSVCVEIHTQQLPLCTSHRQGSMAWFWAKIPAEQTSVKNTTQPQGNTGQNTIRGRSVVCTICVFACCLVCLVPSRVNQLHKKLKKHKTVYEYGSAYF